MKRSSNSRKQRDVFLMRFVEDMELSDIAVSYGYAR